MLVSKVQASTTNQNEFGLLEQAFQRFNEASSKLETKYKLLLEDTNILREKLRQKDLELQRNERLATLGKTAAALAHEVRNPLGAIKLFLSLLRHDLHDRPESTELIDQISISISTLDSVVSNILQFSRDSRAIFAPLNLHAIIQEQCALLKPLEAETFKLMLDLHASPFIIGDEHGLRRVFSNLFINACQALNGIGQLRIVTADQGSNVSITVTDNGPGITESLLETIFDPFVTTKNSGNGLGLAVVRQVVEQHSGSIVARNNCGAEFVVTLPRSHVNAAKQE